MLRTIDLSVSFGGSRTRAKFIDILPWKRDDNTIEYFFDKVDTLTSIVEEIRSTNENLLVISVTYLRSNISNVTCDIEL